MCCYTLNGRGYKQLQHSFLPQRRGLKYHYKNKTKIKIIIIKKTRSGDCDENAEQLHPDLFSPGVFGEEKKNNTFFSLPNVVWNTSSTALPAQSHMITPSPCRALDVPGTRKEVQFYSNRQKSRSSLGHRNDLSLLEVEAFFWTTERRQSNPKASLSDVRYYRWGVGRALWMFIW